MGLKRWLIKSTAAGRLYETTKNIVEEHSVVSGVKKTVKEDIQEDNPITSAIYRSGKYDGEVEGYVEASAVYEQKLLEQADLFIQQKAVFEQERDAYEELLKAYEEEIERLEAIVSRTAEENEYLQSLLLKERQLIKLQA